MEQINEEKSFHRSTNQGVNLAKLGAGLAGFVAGQNADVAMETGENAAENNALFTISAILIAQIAYAAYQGDGNPIVGIDKILAGEDTVSRVTAELAQQGIEEALVVAPETTEAALNILAKTGELSNQVITYVDASTGKVVSGTWSSLSPETQQNIKRPGFIIGAAATAIGAGAVTKISKLPGSKKFDNFTTGIKVPKTGQYVDIFSPQSRQHILHGDGPGSGGHLWPGQPGKIAFPESWSGDKIIHTIGDITTSPNTQWYAQTGTGGQLTKAGNLANWVTWATVDGVRIRVVYQPALGRVVTGFPGNNPIPNLTAVP